MKQAKNKKIEIAEVCSSCLETITDLKNWDGEKKLCSFCKRETEAKLCLKCEEKEAKKEFWGMCKGCFEKRPCSNPSEALQGMKLRQ